MNMNINVGMEGFYTLVVRKKDSEEVVRQVGPFKNLITDLGIDRIAKNQAMASIMVGTGSTPPTVNDTTLQGFVAAASMSTGQSTINSSSPYWSQNAMTARFNAGVATGNLSEVGVGWNNGSGTYNTFSRALILDSSGNPTTITVLSDEVLDVTYTLRQYPVLTDSSFSFQISGVTYNAVCRASYVTNWTLSYQYSFNTATLGAYAGTNLALGAITSGFTGVTNSDSSVDSQIASHTQGTKINTWTFNVGLNQANFTGGIKGLRLSMGPAALISASFDILLDQAIPKTASKILTLSASISWDRYTPS